MARPKLVQFWTDADSHQENQRLDADIFILRELVWERTIKEIRQQQRDAKLRFAGTIALIVSACAAYIWILVR